MISQAIYIYYDILNRPINSVYNDISMQIKYNKKTKANMQKNCHKQ